MPAPLVCRQANPSDLEAVLSLIEQRTVWLHERGSDQWNHGLDYREKIARRVEKGYTWLVEDGREAVATGTLFRRSKSMFWTPEEMDQPTLFAWKMATHLGRAGEGLTEVLFQWVQDWAARIELDWVRWSVWGASRGLHAYYRRCGAELVRVVDVPDRDPVALFQLPARRSPSIALEVRTVIDHSREGASVLAAAAA
jgi:hypothetical protein